jgi:hypothetical protein
MVFGPQFIACAVDLAREFRGGGVVGTSWSSGTSWPGVTELERNRVRLREQDRFAWGGRFGSE